jgi:hypothetical protein
MRIKRILYFDMQGTTPSCVGYWDKTNGFVTTTGEACTESYLHELARGQTLPVIQYTKGGFQFELRDPFLHTKLIPN